MKNTMVEGQLSLFDDYSAVSTIKPAAPVEPERRIHTIQPPADFIRFENDEERMAKLVEWGLFTGKTKSKQLFYKGTVFIDSPVKCTVLGYVDNYSAVISFDGLLDVIHPSYLADMQKPSFGRDKNVSE